jgi:hypothetical protein
MKCHRLFDEEKPPREAILIIIQKLTILGKSLHVIELSFYYRYIFGVLPKINFDAVF